MDDAALLELSLTQLDESRCFLAFRFRKPGSLSETNLGVSGGLEVRFDLPALRTASAGAEAYGRMLAGQLFASDAARSALAQARSICEADGLPLHLRLLITPPQSELHGLRWELLSDPNRLKPICTDENLRFSRFISADSARKFVRPELDSLQAVVMVANPTRLSEDYGLAPVGVEDELARARAGLAGIETTEIADPGQATLDRLVASVSAGCNLVYLVAHGGFGKGSPLLYLEKEDGSVAPVPSGLLINRLSELSRLPLLVVLVSCQSAGTGDGTAGNAQVALGPRLAAAGVPAVIAMQGNVSYQTMEKFMPAFFKELLSDGQIDRALAAARRQVQDRPDWWMPVLFSHLSDNLLFTAVPPWTVKDFEPETVRVRAGKFWMGSDSGPGISPWQCPRHEVDLPAFRIGKYPVTNRQYAIFVREKGKVVNPEMGWDGQKPPAGRLDDPVCGVTWYQAMEYCQWLQEKTGRAYTLPNEAQWEKAARGEQGWAYPWGEEWQEGRANNQPDQVTPVTQFPAQSPYGCFDMVGNVREWTLSLWGDKRSEPDPAFCYPWRDDARNDPQANEQIRRIFRGGVGDNPAEMTCSARDAFLPGKPGPAGKRHGFRIVVNS